MQIWNLKTLVGVVVPVILKLSELSSSLLNLMINNLCSVQQFKTIVYFQLCDIADDIFVRQIQIKHKWFTTWPYGTYKRNQMSRTFQCLSLCHEQVILFSGGKCVKENVDTRYPCEVINDICFCQSIKLKPVILVTLKKSKDVEILSEKQKNYVQ